MHRSAFCAMAIALLAGSASAQSVEFRMVERFGDVEVNSGDAPPTASPTAVGSANDQTLWMVVQARVSGLNPSGFNGLAGYAGRIRVMAGGTAGVFKAAGTGGDGGGPTSNSPVDFFPAGTSPNGFATGGVALYEPFRLLSNLGPGFNGTRSATAPNRLYNVLGATGGEPLTRLQNGELTAAAWGVDAWINIYAFQFDVLNFGSSTLTFETDFYEAGYFTGVDQNGIPDETFNFPTRIQGSYTLTLTPAPGTWMVGLVGLVAARRRRR